MVRVLRRGVLAVTGMAMLAATPAAACWSETAVAAAKVRDLETMLMVSALRCRFSGGDLLARYNSFVAASRPALVEVNDHLRQHFSEEVGRADALDAYDSYVTAVANRYGGGVDGVDCRDLEDVTTAAEAEGASFENLVALAERAGARPLLDGQQCNVPSRWTEQRVHYNVGDQYDDGVIE